jgi:transcription factor 1
MGATNLVPKLTDPKLPPHQRIDPEKWIREYTVQDWELVVEAFKAWPFAPDVSLAIVALT